MDINDLAGKAKEVLSEGGHKAAEAVDKVTDVIDEKTGGKFTSALEGVDDKARELLGEKKDEGK